VSSPQLAGYAFIEKAAAEPLKRVRGTRLVVRMSPEDRAALEEATQSRGLSSVEEAVLEAIRQWLKVPTRRRGA